MHHETIVRHITLDKRSIYHLSHSYMCVLVGSLCFNTYQIQSTWYDDLMFRNCLHISVPRRPFSFKNVLKTEMLSRSLNRTETSIESMGVTIHAFALTQQKKFGMKLKNCSHIKKGSPVHIFYNGGAHCIRKL